MSRTVQTFVDPFGVEVTWYRWAAAEPKGVIVLLHGLGEHALRYEHVATALNAVGFTVVAPDQRGHGATGLAQAGGDHRGLGRLGAGGLDGVAADIDQVTRIAQREGVPVFLVGHSLGSVYAQLTLNRDASPYVGAVLIGSAYRMPGSMASGGFNRPWQSKDATGFEWLSRDPVVGAAFAADPLCFAADAPKQLGIAAGLRLFGRPERGMRHLPLLLQVGSADTFGGERSVTKLAEAYRTRAGLTDVELVVYPDARHEVLNEVNKDDVIADLVAWLAARLPASA